MQMFILMSINKKTDDTQNICTIYSSIRQKISSFPVIKIYYDRHRMKLNLI